MQTLSAKTFLPLKAEEAWHFISNPRNLPLIIPESFQLRILNHEQLPQEIYAGLIIRYKVQPVPLMQSSWTTEITHVEKGSFFVDEQRFGPYAFWHHQHRLTPASEGILMEDIVHYKPPGKWIGNWLLSPFIKKRLHEIFNYRAERLKKLFPGAHLISYED